MTADMLSELSHLFYLEALETDQPELMNISHALAVRAIEADKHGDKR